jgi:malonate transporter
MDTHARPLRSRVRACRSFLLTPGSRPNCAGGAQLARRGQAASRLAPVLGVVLALAGLHLPALVDNAVEEIGKAAGGAALFILGMMMAQNPVRFGRNVLANLALKNFVQPAIMLGAALALKLDPTLTKEVFLIGVMPTATAASVLAQRYGVYGQEAASTTAASTLLAILTISGALAIASTL